MLPENQIITGDSLEVLRTWPGGCISMCVTSPPYWGLRDYGVDGQLGLEKTPEEYVAKMVELFAEVKRVLADHGSLWLNLGDSYVSSPAGNFSKDMPAPADGGRYRENKPKMNYGTRKSYRRDKADVVPTGVHAPNLKPKDLCGIPWRVAFALQADGWYLRQDIIWHKPNPMPESCRDRCTKAHEYIFLLTKKPRYYYDQEAVREPHAEASIERTKHGWDGNRQRGSTQNPQTLNFANMCHPSGRNRRSVWTIPTQAYSEAHFATFPEKLVEPCIKAGCPKEVCTACGKPRERIVEKGELQIPKSRTQTHPKEQREVRDKGWNTEKGFAPECSYPATTTGWTTCICRKPFKPGIVLDPFMGSGTVAQVAARLNRNYVGIELNPEYAEMARKRALHGETGISVKEQRTGQTSLFTQG